MASASSTAVTAKRRRRRSLVNRYEVEQCWTLIGRRIGHIWYARRIRRCAGSPATVEFDASSALEREEQHGDVVGFLHTHPHTTPIPSRRDIRTMRAWCTALGKPLLCVIAGVESGATPAVMAHRFDNGNADGIALAIAELFPRGVVISVEET